MDHPRTDDQLSAERKEKHPWIEWHSGENPAPGKMVCLKLRGGHKVDDVSDNSDALRWNHLGKLNDIIAYRLADGEEQAPAQPTPIDWRTLKPGDRGTITLEFEVKWTDILREKPPSVTFDFGDGESAEVYAEPLDAATIHLHPKPERALEVGDEVYWRDEPADTGIIRLIEGSDAAVWIEDLDSLYAFPLKSLVRRPS